MAFAGTKKYSRMVKDKIRETIKPGSVIFVEIANNEIDKVLVIKNFQSRKRLTVRQEGITFLVDYDDVIVEYQMIK